MLFEIDMLVVAFKLFLADLAEIRVGDGHIEFLRELDVHNRGSFMNTTLNFFFELVFLKGRIVIKVFLY